MMNRIACLSIFGVLCMAAACTADGDLPRWDGSADVEPGDGTDTMADPGSDGVCDEDEFEIHKQIVRVMLLLDQSSSMFQDTRWEDATSALQALLVNPSFADMHFGLDAFPDGHPGHWWNCGRDVGCYACPEDMCGTLDPPQVPLAVQSVSATSIIAHMHDDTYPAFCGNTPLVNQLEYYATGPGPVDAPELYIEDGDSYLVVISDGQDEGCFDGDPVDALTALAGQLVTERDIRSIAIGFGDTSGAMADQLNAIAASGGTSFDTFLAAEDGAALEAALGDIAGVVNTCRYVIDDVDPSASPELVNFYIDGEVVPMDPGCSEDTGMGWHWYDDAHTTVEFCGDLCDRIKRGEISCISATFGCSTYII